MKASEKTEYMRSRKIPPIKMHLFLRVQDCDYLLTLTNKNMLYLKMFQSRQIETFENTNPVTSENPIDLIAGNNQDVYLLCKEGILKWFLTEIKAKASPKKIYLEWPSLPIKIVLINNSQFLVVCQNKSLLFVKNGQIMQQISYPSQMNMGKLAVSYNYTNQQDSLVLIPSCSNRLPYVFKLNELVNWKQKMFLQKYVDQCRQYYLQDEILAQNTDIFCVSATQKLIYLCLRKQLLLLEIKQVVLPNISYVIKYKMALNMRWNQQPLSCTVNPQTGSFTYVGVERIGECNPTKYTTTSRSIRQKSDPSSLITAASYTRQGQILMLSPSSTNESKFYLCKIDEFQ